MRQAWHPVTLRGLSGFLCFCMSLFLCLPVSVSVYVFLILDLLSTLFVSLSLFLFPLSICLSLSYQSFSGFACLSISLFSLCFLSAYFCLSLLKFLLFLGLERSTHSDGHVRVTAYFVIFKASLKKTSLSH